MEVFQLVSSIDATIANLSQGGAASDAGPQKLLTASKRLQATSESPLDSVLSIVLDVSGDNLDIQLDHHK
jgi:hypothetical protein